MFTSVTSSLKSLGLVSVSALSLMACSPQDKATAPTETQPDATEAKAKTELNFGIINTESSQNLKKDWEPLLADLGKATGMEVKPFFASDYAGVIQAMRFGKVDMAWYGNKSAMEAVDRADGEVFAQVVYADGSTGYNSLLIANKDSNLTNEKDVLAKAGELTFGNGDPNSTSGNLVPAYYLFGKNNVSANDIFKRTLNANHESNAMAVANKQLDVATFNSSNWEMMAEKQPQIIAKLKVLWESPQIASDPLVWRKDMAAETKTKVKDFFVGYGSTPEQTKTLATLGWSKFRASDNTQLDPVRELEAFKQEMAKKAK
ncbi:MAG: phosphonate ABC transporter substrate-binding protein [Neisseriaceae bacterium]|nr:phosphonate ABC transporter substrate-binding protein [Neisseriaceae bacterium]MBP6861933.1 phosphonate ABC transporter substrate-binding protein [Neisseriaceae bacterium]